MTDIKDTTDTPLTRHPGITRALRAVHTGEIGLLRAVAVDVVVATDSGHENVDALRRLGPHLIALVQRATGPATVRLQSQGSVDGRSWTLLGQTERDVVVSVHGSMLSASAVGDELLRGLARIVGTHGSIRVDLTRPALTVRRPGATHTVPFVDGGPGLCDIELSDHHDVLRAIEESSHSGASVVTTW